jgi:hypothetical protein
VTGLHGQVEPGITGMSRRLRMRGAASRWRALDLAVPSESAD